MFSFQWTAKSDSLDVSVTASSTGWAAVGFNANGMGMTGARIVLAYAGNINEYTAEGNSMPTLADSQTITNSNAVSDGMYIYFNFTIPFVSFFSSFFFFLFFFWFLCLLFRMEASRSPTLTLAFSMPLALLNLIPPLRSCSMETTDQQLWISSPTQCPLLLPKLVPHRHRDRINRLLSMKMEHPRLRPLFLLSLRHFWWQLDLLSKRNNRERPEPSKKQINFLDVFVSTAFYFR